MEKLKYSILMLDDKPEDLGYLLELLRDVPYLEEPIVLSDVMEAFKLLQVQDIDILFLDMDLGQQDMDGVTFFSMLRNPPVTVACSGFSAYVYKTSERGIKRFYGKTMSVRAMDALLNELVAEVDRKNNLVVRDLQEISVLDVSGEEVQLELDDIYYGEINNNILTVYMEEGTVMLKMTLKGFLAKLPSHRFAKPHNSFFVSLAKVDYVARKNIYLSGTYKDEVLHITQEYAPNFNRACAVYKQNYVRKG